MKKKYDKARTVKVIGSLFTSCTILFLLLLFFMNQRIEVVDVSGCDTASAEKMTYQIEKVSCEYNYVIIKGYAYEAGISIDKASTSVLAYDPMADIYYRLPTENIKKAKLTTDADDGFNYDYAEFKSVTFRKKLPSGCRICILYQGNGANTLIATDQVIFY